jgi:hypothetical protein
MKKSRALTAIAFITLGVTVAALARVSPPQVAPEETISGTISATRVITRNTRLVGDVTCTVEAAPCIQFGAPAKLNLNGFTITGLADPSTGCQGNQAPPAPVALLPEVGVIASGQADVTIQGPGLVQRFRASGILVNNNSSRILVTQVTVSTNCNSGILVANSSDNRFEANVAVRNGTTLLPCGGL